MDTYPETKEFQNVDPMSAEAQDQMDEFNTKIVANARRRIWEQKRQLRELNTFYRED